MTVPPCIEPHVRADVLVALFRVLGDAFPFEQRPGARVVDAVRVASQVRDDVTEHAPDVRRVLAPAATRVSGLRTFRWIRA